MSNLIAAIDTNSLIFLYEAMEGNYDPSKDGDSTIAQERLAIFRIFIYTDCLRITPTAKNEIRQNFQLIICLVHIREIPGNNLDDSRVNELTKSYLEHHLSENDCRILAEATVAGCNCLLSYDDKLVNNLKNIARIGILHPSQFWERVAPKRNSKPLLLPSWDNPKVTQNWYKW